MNFCICRQLIVCVNLLREIGGGHKVEADCDSINNASSFGVRNKYSQQFLAIKFNHEHTFGALQRVI